MSPNLFFFQLLFLENAVSKYVIFYLAFQNLQLCYLYYLHLLHTARFSE